MKQLALASTMIFVCLLSLPKARGQATEASEWRYVAGRPYLPIRVLSERWNLKTYFDSTRSRLLVEGHERIAFFLPWSNYAVINGRFQRIGPALIDKEGEFFIDGALLQSHLLHFVRPEARANLKEYVRSAFAKLDTAVCASDRPVKKVFLDPGHGGNDEGAIRSGIQEKELVLNFAKATAEALRKKGYAVMLSREKDEFIALDLRPELARQWGADVFISLHANTSQFPGARGTETYILSSDATDADARKLALTENAVLPAAEAVSPGEVTLKSILWDIGQTAYLQDSAYLAADIHSSLLESANRFLEKRKPDARWKNRGVREAPFAVLSRAAMPAVLVELAYLSHAGDRDLLTHSAFRQVLAEAIVDGVQKFADHCNPR